MEHRSPIFSHNHQKKPSPAPGNTAAPRNLLCFGVKIEEQPFAPDHNRIVVQDKEAGKCIPIAHVLRIMRRVLPPDAKVSHDAKEAMQALAVEFITFITSEANDWRQDESRPSITSEDVLFAMEFLGFTNYVRTLIAYLERYRNKKVGQSGACGCNNAQN